VTTTFSLSLKILSSHIIGEEPSSGKKVVINLPAPTLFHPAEYSPPTACLSNKTGLSKPNFTPSI